MNILRRLSQHLPRSPFLYLHILIKWLMIPFAISFFSIQRLLRWYSPKHRSQKNSLKIVQSERYLMGVARRLPFDHRQPCLYRSLLRFYFLNRWGETTKIHFGIRKASDSIFQGHCWLTQSDGSIYGVDLCHKEFSEVVCFSWEEGQGPVVWNAP